MWIPPLPPDAPKLFLFGPRWERWEPFLRRAGIAVADSSVMAEINDSEAVILFADENETWNGENGGRFWRQDLDIYLGYAVAAHKPVFVWNRGSSWMNISSPIQWIRNTPARVLPLQGIDPLVMAARKGYLETKFSKAYWAAIQDNAATKDIVTKGLYLDVSQHTRWSKRPALTYHREIPFGPYRPDFLFPNERVIVECDGVTYHSDPDKVIKDKKRDRYFSSRGWLTLRYSTPELEADAVGCANEVIDILLKRTPA